MWQQLINRKEPIKGDFNGFNVVIKDPNDMKSVILQGCFGKGNMSRSFPCFFHESKVEFVRQTQQANRQSLNKEKTAKPKKVIIIPDDVENCEEFKPEYRLDNSGLKECVNLMLEEAFFLHNFVKSLNIYKEHLMLTTQECWKMFVEKDAFFKQNFMVYYYFRSKNWIVKPGIKYGGDYLLYQKGPSFYHAQYVVVIDVLNWQGIRNEVGQRRNFDILSTLGLNRLCETTGKELLICKLYLPDNEDLNYENIHLCRIETVLFKRHLF